MGKFEIVISIDRPVEAVFDYLADVTNTPAWYSAVQNAVLKSGEGPQRGSTYEIVRQLPQGRVTDTVEITEFDRPNLFCFGTDEGSTPFSYRYEFNTTDGGTELKLDGEIEVSGVAKLLGPIATQTFKRGMRANLDSLKAVLERA